MQVRSGPSASDYVQPTLPRGLPAPPVQGVGGIRRLLGLAQVGLVLIAAVAVWEVVAVNRHFTDYAPSTLLGTFSGATEAAELVTKQAVQAEYERRIAEARIEGERQAEARYQERVQTLATNLQTTFSAYETLFQRSNKVVEIGLQMEQGMAQMHQEILSRAQSGLAGGSAAADWACLLGRAFNDRYMQSACGVGRELRGEMMDELMSYARRPVNMPRNVFTDLPDPAQLRLMASPLPAAIPAPPPPAPVTVPAPAMRQPARSASAIPAPSVADQAPLPEPVRQVLKDLQDTPSPAVAASAVPVWRIRTENANIRTAPSLARSAILTALPHGTELEASGPAEGVWQPVRHAGQPAWIHVSVIEPTS